MCKRSLFTSNSDAAKVWKTLVKALCFWGLALTFFFIAILPQYSEVNNASLLDKMDRLQSIESPKIILIGDSNVAFGIRSEMLEEAFGMPVVNMGLHGGLNNRFHQNMARVNTNAGDIVIVFPYGFNYEKRGIDGTLAWITIENHFQLWRLIPAGDWYDMLLAFPTYVKKCLRRYLDEAENAAGDDGPYVRAAYNRYGDNIYSATHENHFVFEEDFVSNPPQKTDNGLERMNRLHAYVTGRGATLLVAAYPVAYDRIPPDREAFQDYEDEIRQRLDCPVISHYEDYFMPGEYFFDTIYHLTDEGARIRTQQLIDDLQTYFADVA